MVVAGGGSGGHIYPALAIVEAVSARRPDLEVLYVGTAHGLEQRIVPGAALPFAAIHARGVLGKGLAARVHGVGAILYGYFEARRLLRRFRPDVVVGTGGYVSLPVGLAAVTARLPLVIQEQNVWPGLTNRVLSRYAARVIAPFPEARANFPRPDRVVVVPNPVRPPIAESPAEARRTLGISPSLRIVMATGGSQGADAINRLMLDLLRAYGNEPGWGMLWATGRRFFEPVGHALRDRGLDLDPERFRIEPYFEPIGRYLRASDLVVGRAGAMTIADLMAYGKPAVLIPSPHVTEDHQTHNARQLERAGAAIVVGESALADGSTPAAVFALLGDDARRDRMARAVGALFDPEASAKMARVILAVAGEGP